MIPRTFPSTYASNGQQQMVVYFLPSIAGLQRWLDYIPIKLAQGGVVIQTDEGEVEEMAPLVGWHVNVRGPMPDELLPFSVGPEHPVRVWA